MPVYTLFCKIRMSNDTQQMAVMGALSVGGLK